MEMFATLGFPINQKRILRLMRKYNILTKIRRMNPYRKLSRATHEHRVVPNRLNREFQQSEPEKVFVTDITYLPIVSGENVYLSCVKDVATHEIVAYKLSTDLRMDLVFQTMKKLEEYLQGNRHSEAMIHSDQAPIRATSDSLAILYWSSPCHVVATVSTTHLSNRSSVI